MRLASNITIHTSHSSEESFYIVNQCWLTFAYLKRKTSIVAAF